VRNPIKHGVCVVFFSNTEELNGKHHLAAPLYAPNLAYARIGEPMAPSNRWPSLPSAVAGVDAVGLTVAALRAHR
jgi:hypothetical protein